MATIYILTNKINGKCYIGKTIKPVNRRFIEHRYSAKKLNTNSIVHKAINKYGWDNFEKECITVANKLVNLWEKHLIKRWGTKTPLGYNMTDGGDGRTSESMIGNKNPMFGRKRSAKTRNAVSKANTGRKWSEETRRKIMLHREKEGFYSTYSYIKNRKLYYVLDTNSNNSYITSGYNELCRKFNLKRGSVNKTIRGVVSHAGGYIIIEIPNKEYIKSDVFTELLNKKINVYKLHNKCYEITTPEKKIIRTKNLNLFAKENNLSGRCMYHVIAGKQKQHKGYTVRVVS